MQACRSVVDFYAGVFNEASGRWNVKLDADDVNRTAVLSHIAARPVNLIQREVSGRNLAAAHSRLLCTALLPLHARICTPDCAHTEARVSLAQEEIDAHAVDEENS